MLDNHLEEPELIFFLKVPRDLMARPPLASSLQHLETSFFLIAVNRYPSALVSCASAVESALKAGFNIDQNKKPTPTFEGLLARARKEYLSDTNFLEVDLDQFRRKRNKIIHYGFCPKDDEISAILLLKTGYRLIEQCYEALFEFPLKQKGKNHGGLLPNIYHQLDIARKVYLKAKAVSGFNLTYCLIAFSHQIRWKIQHWHLSDWQNEILLLEEKIGKVRWEYQEKQKEELTYKIFNASWEFDCPICCDPSSFVCELDQKELEKSIIQLKRGVCVSCSLVIPENCPFLTNELCIDQLGKARPKILKEFGIV